MGPNQYFHVRFVFAQAKQYAKQVKRAKVAGQLWQITSIYYTNTFVCINISCYWYFKTYTMLVIIVIIAFAVLSVYVHLHYCLSPFSLSWQEGAILTNSQKVW